MNIELKCPNQSCKNATNATNAPRNAFHRDGYYTRKHSKQKVLKYKCTACGKCFSTSTLTRKASAPQFKKPELTALIFELYCSRMSMRRIAKVLKCSIGTVQSRVVWLGDRCRKYHDEAIKIGLLKTTHLHFDEMEGYEHTKLKPVSIALGVDGTNGKIIEVKVCEMKMRGPTAGLSHIIYPNRIDQRSITSSQVLVL